MAKKNNLVDVPEETQDNLSDIIEGQLRDESGIAMGVKSLMGVEPSTKGEPNTDIEIKTILEHNQIIDHTIVEFISGLMEMSEGELETKPVIAGLTEKLERKFLSLKGKSREQVVDMVKNDMGMPQPKRGMMGRLFNG